MKLCFDKYVADAGSVFVLTQLGYDETHNPVAKAEREIGKPIRGYEDAVWCSWVDKGYVVEEDLERKDEGYDED